MAKKSILYLVTQSEWGGAQRYIFDLVRGLSPKRERSPEVVVAAGPEGDNKNGLLARLEKIGVKTIHLKYLKRAICPYADGRAFFEIRNLISQIRPDVIHLNSSKAGVLGSLVVKLSRGLSPFRGQSPAQQPPEIIYTVHGWVFNEPLPWWLKKIYFGVEKISVGWKDKIICVSEFDRQVALKARLCPSEKLVTIHNGIDSANMEFLSKEEARRGLSPAKPGTVPLIIGTIAHFYPTKGLQYLVEASRIVLATQSQGQSLIFVIIGDGPERPKLERLIKKYHLENNFFLLGEIPNAAKYLKAFDVFVLSSVKEGLPYTILEAMAAGVPIVATAVGGVPEILKDPSNLGANLPKREIRSQIGSQTGILIRPKNSQELAAKIIYLLNNPEIAQNLAQQARQKVAKEFSLEKMVQETERVL